MKRSRFFSIPFITLSLSLGLIGCGDDLFDDDIVCLCDTTSPYSNPPSELPMMRQYSGNDFDQIDTSDNCKLLKQAIVGQWHAQLPTGHLRYDFNRDGTYSLYRFKNDRWMLTDSGKFWISYRLIRGLLRAQFHMTLGDDVEFPMSFFIQNGNIVFEESVGDVDKPEFYPYT